MRKATIILFLFVLPYIGVFASNKEDDTDPQWTVISIHQVQNSASGLAWDGEYIYIGSYGGSASNKVYRFNPATATNEFLFDAPASTFGLTWDGSNLWVTHSNGLSNPSRANKLDMQGNVIDFFNLPARMMSGIAYDNGDFWAARYESPHHKIYHLQMQDEQYVAVDSFPSPTSQPWELARQGEFLWLAEYNRSEIHKMDLQGNLITTYPASLQRTSGVVYDGQYLWYLSRSSATGTPSFLYQVDLSGGGTPEIVADTQNDFGNVTLENTASWMMQISNTGTGQLTLEDMVFPAGTAFSTSKSFPFNIAAGQSDSIEVTFAPEQINHQAVTALLQTNDPANLEMNILLEGIGLAQGPFMLSHQDQADFGMVRVNSSNRKYLVFQNMGDAPLEISQVDLHSNDFYFDSYVEFPYVLEPVETLELPLWFMPDNTGASESNATVVFNNEQQSPLTIQLMGDAQHTEHAAGDLLWEYQFGDPVWSHATSVLTIPDLNGDGMPDVMLTTRTGHLRTFNANASGQADLIWERHLGIVDFPKAVALASDINGDGLNDIIAGTAISDQAITAVSSRTGENLWRVETSDLAHAGWIYMVDVTHDFNGNGYLDVVAAIGNSEANTGSIICINGLNGEILWHTQLNNTTYSVMVVEDFTGDGMPDVVAGASAAGNKGKVVGLNGTSGASVWVADVAEAARALGQLGDITENGIADIIAGSVNGIYYLLDATNGNIKVSGSTNSRIYDFYNAGDLNLNGHPVFIPTAGFTSNLMAICGKSGGMVWTLPLGENPTQVAIIPDITGNGRNDILVGTRPNNKKIFIVNGAEGTVISSIDLDAGTHVLSTIEDITGNGNIEIITSTDSGFLGVYSCGPKADPLEYTLTFEVRNSAGLPLEGALVSIAAEGLELYTDAQGIVGTDLFPGIYSYTVSLDNHSEASGSIAVDNADLLHEVILESPVWAVTFIVSDNNSLPLENVSIEISADKVIVFTDANGIVSVDLSAGDYKYTAEKENHFPASGQFIMVDEDIVVYIDMQHDGTGIDNLLTEKIRSYPNPFSNQINIDYYLSHDQAVTITFYHSNGSIVYSEQLNNQLSGKNTITWNAVSSNGINLKAGVYFIEIKTMDFLYRDRIIFTGN